MHRTIPQQVKDAVREMEPSADVILYGSRARNDFGEGSDWDFLVLVDGEVDTARTDLVRHRVYEVELDSGEIISTLVRSRHQWNMPQLQSIPLRVSIAKEGVVL